MKKLIELLNEWERERVNHNTKEYIKRGKNSFTSVWIIEIISKHYGFIKRLVDNDKVDLKKANNIDNWPLFDYYYDEDALIMALSINDEPIEFLISILK